MADPHQRRYLDNAATSWPKPEEVFEAWQHAARSVGAAAGRAAHRDAVAADAIRAGARGRIAGLLGGVDPDRVAFCAGATLALNMAIHGLLRPGDHVIATAADHNATLRPLHLLRSRGIIELTIVPCDGTGTVDADEIGRAWRPTTRLVACSHASNVTGAVQDAGAIAAVVHARGGLFLLDAAQTLGQRPLDAGGCGADILAAPSHKWLLGPAGAGILWARSGVEPEPLVQGGTGTASESLEMPESFVERMEAGTPDVPALAGLSAAVDWLEARGVETVGVGCRRLADACAARLRGIGGVRVFGRTQSGAPIVSFTVEGYDPAEIAGVLEQMEGVQARSGFHCAACVHDQIGTRASGTVRVSFGPFNTDDDVEAVVRSVGMLAAAGRA